MEATYYQYASVGEMIEKSHNLSFLGRRSFVPRPISSATDFFDTDFEDDEDDESDDNNSPASLDSGSTLSTNDDLNTPLLTGGLGGYEFHFDDKPVCGPYGPHLFDTKIVETELVLDMSPTEPQAPKTPFESLHTAVAELDESQVTNWTPRQVAQWMTEAGFEESVVEKFLVHDICGSVLLDMQLHDLKEIDISSFGKRHKVMSSIQRLRSSSMFEEPITRQASVTSKSTRSQSTRRGRNATKSIDVAPEESVSIVAIEQLLPQPHVCSKGENCSKWKKQQRKIQRIEEQFAADVRSIIAPSVVASSDILGPSPAFTITRERLDEIQPRDPQDNVRHFLNFQHVNSPTICSPSPPPAPSAKIAQQLNDLPKLTIPAEFAETDSPYRTPASAFRNPSDVQAKLRTELQEDPYHYGGVASPVDVYRLGSPMSATDIPITAPAVDPCARDVSQSVPPEMRYGASHVAMAETIKRSNSTQPSTRRARRPSFTPAITPVRENPTSPTTPIMNEEQLVNHSGWMRKRKTSRMMRHEWSSNYFSLQGSKLDMLENEAGNAETVESIDVDNYVLHAYSTASGSKLSAAFKKSAGGNTEPSFAFSLIPENKKFFEKEKSHHFAVNSGKDRVEWMRKLMLAKAMKKNDGQI